MERPYTCRREGRGLLIVAGRGLQELAYRTCQRDVACRTWLTGRGLQDVALMKLQKEDITLKIGSVIIKPSNSVRDLGVLN